MVCTFLIFPKISQRYEVENNWSHLRPPHNPFLNTPLFVYNMDLGPFRTFKEPVENKSGASVTDFFQWCSGHFSGKTSWTFSPRVVKIMSFFSRALASFAPSFVKIWVSSNKKVMRKYYPSKIKNQFFVKRSISLLLLILFIMKPYCLCLFIPVAFMQRRLGA